MLSNSDLLNFFHFTAVPSKQSINLKGFWILKLTQQNMIKSFFDQFQILLEIGTEIRL